MPLLLALNVTMLPLPFAARPILVLSLVQLYVLPFPAPEKITVVVALLLHITWFAGASTIAGCTTVTVKLQVVILPDKSVAVYVRVVIPAGKVSPGV